MQAGVLEQVLDCQSVKDMIPHCMGPNVIRGFLLAVQRDGTVLRGNIAKLNKQEVATCINHSSTPQDICKNAYELYSSFFDARLNAYLANHDSDTITKAHTIIDTQWETDASHLEATVAAINHRSTPAHKAAELDTRANWIFSLIGILPLTRFPQVEDRARIHSLRCIYLPNKSKNVQIEAISTQYLFSPETLLYMMDLGIHRDHFKRARGFYDPESKSVYFDPD